MKAQKDKMTRPKRPKWPFLEANVSLSLLTWSYHFGEARVANLGQRLFENARKGNEAQKAKMKAQKAKMKAQKPKMEAQKAKMKA